VDQLASAGCSTTPNIEDTFLSLFYQVVETLKVSVAAL